MGRNNRQLNFWMNSLNRDVHIQYLEAGIPYRRSEACTGTPEVVHHGKHGRQFRIKSGIKQGCILPPLMFIKQTSNIVKRDT